jgi:hypothetical protein
VNRAARGGDDGERNDGELLAEFAGRMVPEWRKV